jgi:tetratricopeptide (TPR) repeat protein
MICAVYQPGEASAGDKAVIGGVKLYFNDERVYQSVLDYEGKFYVNLQNLAGAMGISLDVVDEGYLLDTFLRGEPRAGTETRDRAASYPLTDFSFNDEDLYVDWDYYPDDVIFHGEDLYVGINRIVNYLGLDADYNDRSKTVSLTETYKDRYELSAVTGIEYDNWDIDASLELISEWRDNEVYVNEWYEGYAQARRGGFSDDRHFLVGNQYYMDKDYENAIKAYSLCLADNPYHLPAMNNISLSYLMNGNRWQAYEMCYLAFNTVWDSGNETHYSDPLWFNTVNNMILIEHSLRIITPVSAATVLIDRIEEYIYDEDDEEAVLAVDRALYNVIWFMDDDADEFTDTLESFAGQYPDDEDYEKLLNFILERQ